MKKIITYFLFVSLILGCSSVKIQSVTGYNIQITDSIKASNSEISEIIKPYRNKLNEVMNEVLNTSVVEMPKPDYKNSPTPETLLGNFVADLSLKTAKELYKPSDNHDVDFCVLNNGGLRSSLPKGNLTRGKIFELMPFENELVVLTLSGETTRKLFDNIALSEGIPSSGLKMSIKDKKTEFVEISGKPFDVKNTYKVVTSDYLARGGDKMFFFSENIKTENLNIKLRDAIINYIINENKNGRAITSSLDKRIVINE